MPDPSTTSAATATLIIDGWSSSCSACRKSARWDQEGHVMVLGYGDDNGTPGCGAAWASVYFVYGEPVEWPDHMPLWIKDLPRSGVVRARCGTTSRRPRMPDESTTSAASDNPQFDHPISNVDSDEAPYKSRPVPDLPLDERLAQALDEDCATELDETDIWNVVAAVLPVARRYGARDTRPTL